MNHLRITNSESFCSIRTKVSKRAHHSIISNNNNHSKNKRTHTRGGLLCEWTDELTKDKCHNKYENCHCFRRRCGISPYKRQVIQKIIDHQIISILCILLFFVVVVVFSIFTLIILYIAFLLRSLFFHFNVASVFNWIWSGKTAVHIAVCAPYIIPCACNMRIVQHFVS